MAGLLDRLRKMFAAPARNPAEKRRRDSGRRTRSSAETLCVQCGALLRRGIPRCPGCGRRAPAPPRPSSTPEFETPPAEINLSKLQIEILLRTLDSEHLRIHALPPEEGEEGEIKAGNVRISGDEAVAAIDGLLIMGFVSHEDENSFILTDAGRRIASHHQSAQHDGSGA